MGGEVPAGLPFLKSLLSVDPGIATVASMDAEMRKARTFESLRAFTVAGSAIRPVVLVFEDLHWMDRPSEEWVSYLAEAVSEHHVLLILTHRPGYEHPFGERSYYTNVRLAGLSERESAALAEGVLADGRLPDELERRIGARAEGNPFFVEEVVRSLLETKAIHRTDDGYVLARPIEEIHVPDTVQDVITARLDRLDDEPKRALQTAAVIGREFTVRLLERTAELQGRVEDYLRDLKAVELIHERALYPELAYMFKHALTHDVAYSSLLQARQKALHRLVGEAIEGLYADRLAEQYETLAYHYERAEAWDQALDYLRKSGDKALEAYAAHQAVGFYNRALAVHEKSSQANSLEPTIALHYGRGQALLLIDDRDECMASFHAMLQAARAMGDRRQEGVALAQISSAHTRAHQLEAALDYAERARQLAVDTGDQAVVSSSLHNTAQVRRVTGDLEGARMATTEALRAAQQADSPLLRAQALRSLGKFDHWQGDHARALERFDEAVRVGREHQVLPGLLVAIWEQGLAHCALGEYDRAIQLLREALELLEHHVNTRFLGNTLNTLGWVYMDLCNWDLALDYNGRAAAEARALGDPEVIRNSELNLADCHLAMGRLDEAQRYLETVERESQRQGTWGETWMKWRYTQHLHASLGELWLARSDPAKAIECADACLAVAEATTSRRNIVKGRRLKGEALLAQDRTSEAEAELEQALVVARYVGNPAQLRLTLAALGRLRRAQGREEDAAAAYHEAIAVVERVAAGLSDFTLRETLLASPQISSLRDALILGQRRA
jgi:tetratricopeptide (TPR) repeat protein